MKFRLAISASTALALALSACGGESESESSDEASGGEFNIAWSGQPPTMDPLLTTANVSRDIARNFYEPLLTLDSSGEVQPVLAEDFEVSEDGTMVTINLREDVPFHDGSTMDAEDAIASLERWVELTNVGQTFFSNAVIESPEEGVVTFTFDEAMWAAPMLIADQGQLPFIMPADIIADAGPEGVQDFIGTGPFEFVEWNTDQHIRLDRFEDYAQPEGPSDGDAGPREPSLDSIYFHFVSDPMTRLSGLQTGEYDASDNVPWDHAETVQEDEEIELVTGDYGLNFAIFNKAEGPMTDINMRRAVLAAITPEENLQAAFSQEEFYGLSRSLAPEETTWYVESDDELMDQDQETIDGFLEAAGYDGEVVEILTTRELEHTYNVAIVLQEQLEQAGINTNLSVMDWGAMLQYRDENPDAWDISNTNDAWRAVPVTWGFLLPPLAGWTDSEEIATAIDDIVYSSGEEDALEAMVALQTAVDEYAPVATFGSQRPLTAVRKEFEGYEYAYFAGHQFYNVRLAE